MGRKAFPLNTTCMQVIMRDTENGFVGTQTEFLQLCCDKYNEKYKPEKLLYPAIIYNRIKKNELTTTISSTRGTLSEERKRKLIEGRKNIPRGRRKRINTDMRHEVCLRNELGEHTKLVERTLQGSMSAAIKLKCIDCCCGDREEVRHCTSYGCPLYQFRPYQKNELTPAPAEATVGMSAA